MGNGLGAWIQFFSGRLQVSYGVRYLWERRQSKGWVVEVTKVAIVLLLGTCNQCDSDAWSIIQRLIGLCWTLHIPPAKDIQHKRRSTFLLLVSLIQVHWKLCWYLAWERKECKQGHCEFIPAGHSLFILPSHLCTLSAQRPEQLDIIDSALVNHDLLSLAAATQIQVWHQNYNTFHSKYSNLRWTLLHTGWKWPVQTWWRTSRWPFHDYRQRWSQQESST